MDQRTLSVLVIDDEADVLAAVKFCLRGAEWRVTTATEGNAGVELARTLHPDVILCDAAMPGMTGAQVIDMLKRDPLTASIPIILMTGIGEAHRYTDIPWNNFLAKPFGPGELRAAIASALAGGGD
jgi:CheY-like chemotaxis protein